MSNCDRPRGRPLIEVLFEEEQPTVSQQKNIYIIWKEQNDRNVRNVNEVVGVFVGTWEEADAIVEKLNTGDESVGEPFCGRLYYGYWRSEPAVITTKNVTEFLPC